MPALDSSITAKAFGAKSDDSMVVSYEAHQEALRYLDAALRQANGVALLHGPEGSGKTTIIKEQLDWSSRETTAALLNGENLTPRGLITGMLRQFGVHSYSDNDQYLQRQVRHFVRQQTRNGTPPLLIVDDADRAKPSTLRQLNWLAAMNDRGKYSLRIILAGAGRLTMLLRHEGLRNIARRHPATYSLNPMTKRETITYLRTRLTAAGCEQARKFFPIDVCEKLHEVSRGWPGLLNKRAMKVMESLQEPKPEKPKIIVSCDGKTVAKYELSERQYVIGRTELADILIEDSYVSKLHAMLKVYKNAVVLLDLNSANGTTVNSTVVQNTVLRSNDIIMLGRHRIKIENVPPASARMSELINVTDTMTLQSVYQLRRSRARRAITVLERRPL